MKMQGLFDNLETDGLYYINRCAKCQSVITKLQIIESNNSNPFHAACPCGSRRSSPSNLLWYENLLPRVMWLTLLYWANGRFGLPRVAPAPMFVPMPAPSLPEVADVISENAGQDGGYV
jgi:hypothetical protein